MSLTGGRRILITGGAGFIGYHLAARVSEFGEDEVVLVDNFARGQKDEEWERLVTRRNVQCLSLDLTQPTAFDQLGRGYDEVYHLAAIIGVRNVLERPEEVLRVNALSTLLLLGWFANQGGAKVLFSSTSEAYAWTQQFYSLPVPTPEQVPLALTDLDNPRSSYAGSKIFGELAVRQYCRVHKKPFAIVRYHNVYGPRMGHDHVVPELYRRASRGENPLKVYSAGHTRAFCYVSDAITATIAAMRTPAADGEVFNVGNDREEVTIGELAQRILRLANLTAAIEASEAKHDPIQRRCPDLSRTRKLLHVEPQVLLDEGLAQTLAWYRQRTS